MNRVLLFASLASLITFGNSMTVTVHVKDEAGNPAVGAIVKIWTDKDRYQGLSRSPTYSYFEAITDTNGMAVLNFPCHSPSIYGCVYGDCYYREDSGLIPVKSTFNWFDFSVALKERSKEVTFVVRKKRKPSALCYAPPWPSPKLPKASGEFGFDLLENDWVAPYGDGKVADFYVQRETSPTNNQVTVNSGIKFKGEGNGAYIHQKIKTSSDFKTDYEADTNETYQAYLPLCRHPAPKYPQYTYSSIVKEDEYIVMRTRVEKNVKGEIIKAHYSAMYGRVRIGEAFYHQGYVFNPMPNDPNLEMDLKSSVDLERDKKRRRRFMGPKGKVK